MSRENRFVELSEEEIKSLLDKKTPKNTKKATNFGMKVFDGKKYIFLFVNDYLIQIFTGKIYCLCRYFAGLFTVLMPANYKHFYDVLWPFF